MDKELAMRWVSALRSGKYSQGKGCLVSPGEGDDVSHCCLGVLVDISGKAELNKERTGYIAHTEAGPFHVSAGILEFRQAPDRQVAHQFFGLKSKTGVAFDEQGAKSILIGDKVCSSLATANDNGRTFAEIADAIEANYEHL